MPLELLNFFLFDVILKEIGALAIISNSTGFAVSSMQIPSIDAIFYILYFLALSVVFLPVSVSRQFYVVFPILHNQI